jgi:hypothetical protein
MPGEMWKTEGYFESVVWKGYADHHPWLVEEDGSPKHAASANGAEQPRSKIAVHPSVDSSAEAAVNWAVGEILGALDRDEELARSMYTAGQNAEIAPERLKI